MFYDLSSDPHENASLFATELTNGWMLAPVFKDIMQYKHAPFLSPFLRVGERNRDMQQSTSEPFKFLAQVL